jgi:hypothetical protein
MSKIILCITMLLLIKNISVAQIQKEDIVIVHSMFTKTKKAIISEYMDIKPYQTLFWDLYDEYEGKRKDVLEERYALLKAYGEQYSSLDNATATILAERFMKNTAKAEVLNKRYFKKFKKLIGGLQAATLFQIEIYIQTAMQASTLTQIPIIGELQKLEQLNQQASRH